MAYAPPARHLLRARDLADARFFEPLDVDDMARAAGLSRADICFSVGLQSVGSFTTSFTRTYGASPTVYRAGFPPAVAHAVVPSCIVRAYGRPQGSTFREDKAAGRG